MAIDLKTVGHVAVLSRLEISEEQADVFRTQLSRIIEYFDQLSELDTQGVEPMSRVKNMENVFREDLPGSSLSSDQAVGNAPETGDGTFRVPSVM